MISSKKWTDAEAPVAQPFPFQFKHNQSANCDSVIVTVIGLEPLFLHIPRLQKEAAKKEKKRRFERKINSTVEFLGSAILKNKSDASVYTPVYHGNPIAAAKGNIILRKKKFLYTNATENNCNSPPSNHVQIINLHTVWQRMHCTWKSGNTNKTYYEL